MLRSLNCCLLLLAFIACRKPEPYIPLGNAMTYFTNAGLGDFQSVRMFTRAGEIKNDSLINVYRNQFALHFYRQGDRFGEKYYQRFGWITNDSILNLSVAPVSPAKKTRSGAYDLYSTNANVFLSDTNDIHLKFLTYKTFHPKKPAGGLEYFEWENPSYVLRKKGDSLLFPIYKYILVYRGDYFTSFRSDYFNNIFYEQANKQLAANDTLLIQGFHVVMKKE